MEVRDELSRGGTDWREPQILLMQMVAGEQVVIEKILVPQNCWQNSLDVLFQVRRGESVKSRHRDLVEAVWFCDADHGTSFSRWMLLDEEQNYERKANDG